MTTRRRTVNPIFQQPLTKADAELRALQKSGKTTPEKIMEIQAKFAKPPKGRALTCRKCGRSGGR